MTIERINPSGLPPAVGYSHVVATSRTRTIYIAGQVGVDETGAVVGNDHRSQAERALRNLLVALEAAGATIEDVVKLNFLVVDVGPEVMEAIFAAAFAVFGDQLPSPAATLYGVQALAEPDHLFEIDAVAML